MTRNAVLQEIPFGSGSLEFSFAAGRLIGRLEPIAVRPPPPPETIIQGALARPIGSSLLREVAHSAKSAAILVSGKDRVAGASVYLPFVLNELNEAGIPDRRIIIVLATGTHSRHTPAEAGRLLGKEAVARVVWREHDCRQEKALRHIGRTSRGTEVWVNRDVLQAGVKVLTGRIIPHYFAGYSGGRKSLVPGVAGFSTICANHRLTLHADRGTHPRVGLGVLRGNPVHLDMLEASQMVRGTFLLNTLLDARHRMVRAFAGDAIKAHQTAVAAARRLFRIPLTAPVDAALVSAGGAPYDCNFLQAIKAVMAVAAVVRPGGRILWVAQCPDGIRDEFLEWGRIARDEDLERAVRAGYNLAAHNTIMLRALCRRAEVALLSDLPADAVQTMGLTPIRNANEGSAWLRSGRPKSYSYITVPYGNISHVAYAKG